jgi:hypothetical protein
MTEDLRRAAQHESGHACTALYFSLPLRGVTINSDGFGCTAYSRRLSVGEVEPWMVIG